MAEGPGSSAWLNRTEGGTSQPPPYSMVAARPGSFGQSGQQQSGASDGFAQGYPGYAMGNTPGSGYSTIQRGIGHANLGQLLARSTTGAGAMGGNISQPSWRPPSTGFPPQLSVSDAQKIQQQKILAQLASVPLHHRGAGSMGQRQGQPPQQPTPSQPPQSLQLPAGVQPSQIHPSLQQLQSGNTRSPAPPPFDLSQPQQQGVQQPQQPMMNPSLPSHLPRFQQQVAARLPNFPQMRSTAPPPRAMPQQQPVPPKRPSAPSSGYPVRFAVDPVSLPPLLPKIQQVREELARVDRLPPEQREIQAVKLQKQLYILLAAFQEQERRKKQMGQGVPAQGSSHGIANVAQQYSMHSGRMFEQGSTFRGTPQAPYNMGNLGQLYNQQMNANKSGSSKKAKGGRSRRRYDESDEESETETDEDSVLSSPGLSPSAIPEEGLRRSTRNVQRKTYKDDLDIHLSGDEESKKQDDAANGAEQQKDGDSVLPMDDEPPLHASYFLTAPDEADANVVEKILIHRRREPKDEQEDELLSDDENDVEYFVKYKNYSYLHSKWSTIKELGVGDKRIHMKVKRYHQKRAATTNLFELPDEDEPINPDYVEVDRVLDVAKHEENGEMITHYLVKWKSLNYEDSTWELEKDVPDDKVQVYYKLRQVPPISQQGFKPRPQAQLWRRLMESPEFMNSNKLRDYQLEGLNWLLFNWYNCQNCILADEMGLGKTIQTIAFLTQVQAVGVKGPFLVVAPLSTLANWQREFETWSNINSVVYHGSLQSRRMIGDYEMYHRDDKGNLLDGLFKFEVMITTYEMVKIMAEIDFMRLIPWRVAVVDEAHRLKNKSCKLLEGLNSLRMEHKVLLTGTPLQNNVEELYSLLNFLEPARFCNEELFMNEFSDLKSESQVHRLKQLLKPMMLRRLKEDVEKSIAAKEETIIEVELTSAQKRYYRAILERNFTFLVKGSHSTSNLPSLMNIMMELRKCCNHPFLINGAEERIISEFNIGIRPGHPEYKAPGEIMVLSSGKLVLIDKLLPKLKAGGHKVLIFSQMIRCLDILEDYMNSHGYLYERIDGRVRGSLRQAAIDRFSRPDSDRFVFLLCTRAGGLGINLTAADTVIIFDSDWNPQNDLQAQARCHRIGQDKAVKVYRLVTRNTYEREMFDRASMKLGLDRAVLQSMNSGNAAQPQMTKKQVEELLKKGAYGALMDDDTDSAKFCEEDIDQILERRTQVIVLDSEAKGSTFAKASFTSAESHIDIDIDDPDFWEKWAKKAQVDTRRSSRSELILHHPRQRKQTKRYVIGSESHDMADFSDSDPDVDEEQLIPGSKIVQKGYSRAECFKVEKQLLTYGWNRWRDILENGNFKRKMTQRDVEAIARMMCVYCLHCCKPDERIREAVLDILALPSTAEDQYDAEDGRKRRRRKGTKKISRSAAQHFGMQDTAVLLNKDPNTFFEDEGYKKHLQNHANKVLNRVRQLVFLEKDIIGDRADLFLSGVPAGDLDLTVPPAEGDPPAAWWDEAMDLSLLVGVFKFGYEKYAQMYDDPSLCFMERCGRPPTSGKKAEKINKTEEEEEDDEDTHIEDADSQESAAGGDGKDLDTPAYESHRMTTRSDTERGNKPPFPPPADVNTRFRRLIAAFMKLQRKEQSRRLQARKEQQRRQKFEEMVKQKEIRRAEMAQKWSKREEQDFYRTLSSYGVVRDPSSGQYDWSKFRVLAKLEKKGNDRLSRYYEEFLDMCHLVCNKSSGKPGMKHNRTGKFAIDPISEEKASRVIQRVQLLSAIREEILTHPELQTRLQLCQHSFDLPSWWLVGKHDHELLIGVSKHGLARTEIHVANDPELTFLQYIPEATQPIPATNVVTPTSASTPDLISPAVGEEMRSIVNEDEHCDSQQNVSDETENAGNNASQQPKGQENSSHQTNSDVGVSSRPGSTPVTPIRIHPPVPIVNLAGTPLDAHAASVIAQWQARWPKERVVIHRLSQIIHCVRNNAWPLEQPRPLMSPTFMQTKARVKGEEEMDDDDEDRAFKVKQVSDDGLKMTFRKNMKPREGLDSDFENGDSDSGGEAMMAYPVSTAVGRKGAARSSQKAIPRSWNATIPDDVFAPIAAQASPSFDGSVNKRGKGKVKGVAMDDSDEEWGMNTGGTTKKRGKKQKTDKGYVPDAGFAGDVPRETIAHRRPKRKAAERRVVVVHKETGERLTGTAAPTAKKLQSWLEENPDYEVEQQSGEDSDGRPLKRQRPAAATTEQDDDEDTDMSGEARVYVVNRETGAMVTGTSAPRLSKLSSWLEANPAFDVASDWREFVLQNNALKPQLHHRLAVAQGGSCTQPLVNAAGFHPVLMASTSPLVSPIQTCLPGYPDGVLPMQHGMTPTSPTVSPYCIPQLGVVPGAVPPPPPPPFYYPGQVPVHMPESIDEKSVTGGNSDSENLQGSENERKGADAGDDYSPDQSNDDEDM